MQKPLTQKGVTRLWENMKKYMAQQYPHVKPPDLLFDPATATLYIGDTNSGYDFIVDGATLYYKERSV